MIAVSPATVVGLDLSDPRRAAVEHAAKVVLPQIRASRP
jgi:hypothetical protein